MINIETDVFDAVYKAVYLLIPEGCFTSDYVAAPPALPHATLIEMDNYTDRNTLDTALHEKFAVVTYEANVYAEDKFTCRNIMDVIDTKMQELGFTRLSLRQVDNAVNTSIYRLVARYRAEVSKNKKIYRR